MRRTCHSLKTGRPNDSRRCTELGEILFPFQRCPTQGIAGPVCYILNILHRHHSVASWCRHPCLSDQSGRRRRCQRWCRPAWWWLPWWVPWGPFRSWLGGVWPVFWRLSCKGNIVFWRNSQLGVMAVNRGCMSQDFLKTLALVKEPMNKPCNTTIKQMAMMQES